MVLGSIFSGFLPPKRVRAGITVLAMMRALPDSIFLLLYKMSSSAAPEEDHKSVPEDMQKMIEQNIEFENQLKA